MKHPQLFNYFVVTTTWGARSYHRVARAPIGHDYLTTETPEYYTGKGWQAEDIVLKNGHRHRFGPEVGRRYKRAMVAWRRMRILARAERRS